MDEQFIITPSHFYKFEKDPMWIYHDAFSASTKSEPLSEFILKTMEEGNQHEKKYDEVYMVDDNQHEKKYDEVVELDPKKGVEATLKLMMEGSPLIKQGWLEKREGEIIYRGRPDFLKKQPGISKFGDWIYAPVDVKFSSKVKILHKQQLAFYCMMLESVQNYFPTTVAIINHNFEYLYFSIEENVLTKMKSNIKSILTILNGRKPDVFISNSAKETPWYKECLQEAVQVRDISLIYKLQRKPVEALRNLGIDTIDKMAVQDIDALPKIPGASLVTLRRAKIQAQSLVENKPIFIGGHKPVDKAHLKLYFDIEGDSWLGIKYLFGFWIVGDVDGKYASVGHVLRSEEYKEKYFLYFLAEESEDEVSMWNDFLEWLRILPSVYSVYHFSSYEKTAIKKLSEKYQTSDELRCFQDRLVDLRKWVDSCVVLPIYFYSIKDIVRSPFVNFKWRHEKAGGEQSILWYRQWLETKNRQILQDIIEYNEDDTRAAEHLHLWITNSLNC